MGNAKLMMTCLLGAAAVVSCSQGEKQADVSAPADGMSIQLYSIRDLIGDSARYAANHESIFSQLARMGYVSVEAANYGDGRFYGVAPGQFKADCEAAGLKAVSSHTTRQLSADELASHDFTEAMKWWDEAIAAHKEAGMEYIVTPWAALPASIEEARTMADYHNAVGEKCREAGLRYGYHTHSHEYDKIAGTDSVWIDYLVEHTAPENMFWQIDTYHAVKAWVSPVAYIKKYPGRFDMLHVKDLYELGQSGMVDMNPIYAAAQQAGTKVYVVEQEGNDGTRSLMESMAENAAYMSALMGKETKMADSRRGEYFIADKSQADISGYPVDDEGYIVLFDGRSLGDWRGYGMDEAPRSWNVDDGAIHLIGSGTGEAQMEGGGDLIFPHKFKNFELELEYRISKGGNSGIFYLAQEAAVNEDGEQVYLPIWQSASEYQVLDNDNHEDARLGVDGNRQSASLYDMIPAKPQNARPHGEWNKAKITVYKGTVIHGQNGENVLEYHLWTPKWKEMLRDSKFNKDGDFPCAYNLMINMGGPEHAGYIGLQDHGDDVWYRNIRVKLLD